MQKFIKVFINFGMVASVMLAISGLIYRSTVYWTFPVVEGEPYGFGDVLDFGFFFILALCVFFTFVAALIQLGFGPSDSKPHSLKAVAVGIMSFVIYYNVHSIMPRLL